MTNQCTIDKLIEMRLTAMADAFRIQKDDSTMKEIPFDDRFGMLVDIEYNNRKNNRMKRLIHQAELEQPGASVTAIDYHSGRRLNKELMLQGIPLYQKQSGKLFHCQMVNFFSITSGGADVFLDIKQPTPDFFYSLTDSFLQGIA